MKNFVQKGKHLTFVESAITKPSHSDSRVHAGDPVLIGRISGVAQGDSTGTTDNVVVVTEGVFNLSVASIGNGLSLGETVFIDPSTAVLSEDPTDTPFGVALDTVSAGQTKTIPIRLFGATPGATGYFS